MKAMKRIKFVIIISNEVNMIANKPTTIQSKAKPFKEQHFILVSIWVCTENTSCLIHSHVEQRRSLNVLM